MVTALLIIDMEGPTTFDMDEYKYELDAMCKNVMPDHWSGHGRIAIHEAGFSGKKLDFAGELFNRLSKKNADKPSKKLASIAIEKANENFD